MWSGLGHCSLISVIKHTYVRVVYGPALHLATQPVRHLLVREGDLYKTPTFFGSCDRPRLRGLWGFRSV